MWFLSQVRKQLELVSSAEHKELIIHHSIAFEIDHK